MISTDTNFDPHPVVGQLPAVKDPNVRNMRHFSVIVVILRHHQGFTKLFIKGFNHRNAFCFLFFVTIPFPLSAERPLKDWIQYKHYRKFKVEFVMIFFFNDNF